MRNLRTGNGGGGNLIGAKEYLIMPKFVLLQCKQTEHD